MEMQLSGKTALVTGAGTGIGRAVSLALAQKGAAVAVNYSRSVEEAEETVQTIRGLGGKAMSVQVDISQDSQVRRMVAFIEKEWGPIGVLVNNAGITRHLPLWDLEGAADEIWDELFAVNVKGMFYCARAVTPSMKALKEGAIVNMGSIAGLTGSGSSLPYAVSKAAVHGLTKSLAKALAPEIRVCSVAPGAVATRWWEGREEQMLKLSPHLPLQRIAVPADIAALVCAILEQDAMTGQIITADAGQTMA
jgi:3-oxoacyl-[acyl-carrier protein] reductase